jgi:CheY-like chemotaxis protein
MKLVLTEATNLDRNFRSDLERLRWIKGASMRSAIAFLPSRSSSDDTRESGASSRPSNGHKRVTSILIVEDDTLIRMAVSDYLRETGYRVLEAASAEEAKTLIQAPEPIELVLSDVNLPKLDGIALARWLAREFADVRVVLTSGDPRNEREAKSVAIFLAKPFKLDLLSDIIKQLV